MRVEHRREFIHLPFWVVLPLIAVRHLVYLDWEDGDGVAKDAKELILPVLDD